MAYGATLTLPTITGSHTDFPVLLKEADFPAGAKDGGANSILNGGGDLRAYTSSAKTTQLPLEVVTFVAGGTPDIEVYVKIPTAATSNTIFIEADATETTQPAVTATYGRNAVWADYESVLHLTESGNGTSGEFADSSGNGVTGKVGRSTSVQKTTGMPWGGNWQELDGNDDYILVENSANLLDGSDFTVQAVWQNLATLTNFDEGLISNWEIAQAANHFRIAPQDDGVDGIAYGVQDGTGDNNAKGTVPAVNDVVYSHLTANASSVRGYEDGSQAAVDTSIAGDNQFVTAKTIKIGTYYDLTSGRSLKCMVGRVRLRLSALSADWIATEHANMDASSNWVTVGAWADAGGAGAELAGDASGQAAATGALTTDIPLAGASLSVATANGAISTSIPLDGLAAAVSLATGALSAQIKLDGAAIGQALANAGLTTDILLAAASAAQAAATGDLTAGGGAAELAGDAAGVATADGDLDTGIDLSGDAAGQADAAGDLSTSVDMAGGATGVALATGDLTIQITLAGDAVSQALATGALTAPGSGLSGDAAAEAGSSGLLTTQIPLAGSATAVATGSGNLSTILQLSGAAAAASNAAGGLTTSITLNGAALAQALAGGDLTTVAGGANLAGDALVQALAGGSLTTQIPLDGDAVGVAVAAGNLTAGAIDIPTIPRWTATAGKRNWTVEDKRSWEVCA